MTDDPPSVLLLFALGLLTDAVWTRAVTATNAGHARAAAVHNMLLAAIGLGSTWSIVSHNSLLEAAAYILGCGLGTFLSVKPNADR